MNRIIILFAITAVALVACGRSKFVEYPPNAVMNQKNQENLLKNFVRSTPDSVNPHANMSLEGIKRQYRLQYFVQRDSSGYFLITFDGNPFFKDEGYHFYGGNVHVDQRGDTVFTKLFERESSRTSDDSVKLLYKKILGGEEVTYLY